MTATATETRRIMGLAGVAAYLGVPICRVEAWVRSRAGDPLPTLPERGPRRALLFDPAEVDAWVEANTVDRGNGPTIATAGAQRPYQLGHLEQLLTERNDRDVAGLLGIHIRQLYRLRRSGLTEVEADELACRAGLHPAIVWPAWGTEPLEEP